MKKLAMALAGLGLAGAAAADYPLKGDERVVCTGMQYYECVIHEGCRNVIVNMEKVKWVNSTGLGILISGYTTLKKSGGELKLLKVSDRIENIFIVSKLFTVFESYQDEEEAVRSFS